jgi:hypothetical protein
VVWRLSARWGYNDVEEGSNSGDYAYPAFSMLNMMDLTLECCDIIRI